MTVGLGLSRSLAAEEANRLGSDSVCRRGSVDVEVSLADSGILDPGSAKFGRLPGEAHVPTLSEPS